MIIIIYKQILFITWSYTNTFLACRTNSTTDKPETITTVYSPSNKFLCKFSSNFCLRLSSMVLKSISTGDETSTMSSSYSALKQLGGDTFENVPSTMLDGDRLPYDSLWQDIMQNINKGHGAKDYIYITPNEIDRLEQQLTDSDTAQGQGHFTPSVFFTCGHYYTKASFIKEAERLDKDAAVGGIKLPETLTVIKVYYSRKSCMPLACPRCVLGAMMLVS